MCFSIRIKKNVATKISVITKEETLKLLFSFLSVMQIANDKSKECLY